MKFIDLNLQYKSIKREIDQALKRVLAKGLFIGGEEVINLEKEIAKLCRVRYALGLNSGTDALYLSFKALGIGKGDEVITTPFTFFATAEVIAALGAKPVFVDIEPESFNINPLKVEEKISKKTKAILAVHLFGQMAEMGKLQKIARNHKLYLVEDAAQAIGASYKGKMAGSLSDIGCLSFFPTKNLGAFGDGGMVVTCNKKLAERIWLLRNHGSSKENKYCNLVLGVNSRLDTLQAAILRVKLKHLSQWNRKRQENAKLYNKMLKGVGDVVTPISLPERKHIFHQYTIRTQFRNELIAHLAKSNIPCQIYYPLALHLQPAFKYLRYKKGHFPEAEKAAKEVVSLPIYPELPKADQKRIVREIARFFKKKHV